MNELNISAVDATAMETATTTSAPKHKPAPSSSPLSA